MRSGLRRFEMPIYEYACARCGHEVEVWQRISDKPKKKCPACGALKLERLISNTSFHLKGSGWYVTDYANKGKSSSSSSKSSSSKSSGSKSSSSKS